MEKNRDYCFRHSRMYEGWQCPACAHEEERVAAPPAQAPAKAPGTRPPAAAPAAIPGPRGGQEQSRAQSKSKTDQAEAMLVSGSAREALEMCEAAIEMDRRNLAAHLVGARASSVLRDTTREHELLAQAVKLLGSEEYGKASQCYIDVLNHLRDPMMVAQLTRAFAAAHQWPTDEALAMVKALVARGAAWEAVVVLDALPATRRTLLTCAYNLQLTATPTAGMDPDLRSYLHSVPALERARVLAEMYEVQASEVLSGMTRAKVRDAVRARYEEWTPDIKQLMSADARKVAAERVTPKVNAPAASWAVRFFVGALVLAIVLVASFGGGVPGILIGSVLAVGCAAIGFAYGRDVELRKLIPTVLPDVKEEMTTREADRWKMVLSDDPADAGPPAAAPEAAPTACPHCAAPVTPDVTICPRCTRPLSGSPGDGPAAEAPVPEAAVPPGAAPGDGVMPPSPAEIPVAAATTDTVPGDSLAAATAEAVPDRPEDGRR